MVTVVEYAIRKTKDDREFIALILQGGLCLVQSKQTNNFYATVKRCSVPSTFDVETAKGMIGEKIPVPGTLIQQKSLQINGLQGFSFRTGQGPPPQSIVMRESAF